MAFYDGQRTQGMRDLRQQFNQGQRQGTIDQGATLDQRGGSMNLNPDGGQRTDQMQQMRQQFNQGQRFIQNQNPAGADPAPTSLTPDPRTAEQRQMRQDFRQAGNQGTLGEGATLDARGGTMNLGDTSQSAQFGGGTYNPNAGERYGYGGHDGLNYSKIDGYDGGGDPAQLERQRLQQEFQPLNSRGGGPLPYNGVAGGGVGSGVGGTGGGAGGKGQPAASGGANTQFPPNPNAAPDPTQHQQQLQDWKGQLQQGGLSQPAPDWLNPQRAANIQGRIQNRMTGTLP